MSTFVFTPEPPNHWDAVCSTYSALFHSPGWQSVLNQAFGSQTMYGWNAGAQTGVAITVFKVGPFRVGYVGFPIGGAIGASPLEPTMVLGWQKAYFPAKLHCLRFPVSAFNTPMALDLPCQKTPETAILELQEWQITNLPKLRRDIKKASSTGLQVIDAQSPAQGNILHRFYRDTVLRHGGKLRYNVGYFSSLISLAQRHPGLRCLLAILDEEVVGFLIVVLHARTAYYLHGAANPSLKQLSPSDVLLHEAINWAQDKDMDCFNMMPSPSHQTSLVRYKEKWGGITKQQQVFDLAVKPFHSLAFRMAERLYRLMW
ncbi:MAG: GNAT family N-acetyltransferase [Acidiferrobacterales bacterium]